MGNNMIIDYADEGSTPIQSIRQLLRNAYNGRFDILASSAYSWR
jgi:hypothetical protein